MDQSFKNKSEILRLSQKHSEQLWMIKKAFIHSEMEIKTFMMNESTLEQTLINLGYFFSVGPHTSFVFFSKCLLWLDLHLPDGLGKDAGGWRDTRNQRLQVDDWFWNDCYWIWVHVSLRLRWEEEMSCRWTWTWCLPGRARGGSSTRSVWRPVRTLWSQIRGRKWIDILIK